jgi:protein TonB
MKVWWFFLLFIVSTPAFCQEDTTVYEIVDKDPEFPGGMPELMQWITSQEIQYEEGLLNGTCSKIYLQFIVEKDGSISNVKSLRT